MNAGQNLTTFIGLNYNEQQQSKDYDDYYTIKYEFVLKKLFFSSFSMILQIYLVTRVEPQL